ncbi:MAG TPA: D-glycero-beta-D-manno-heptose 1-phosphate adenylyltransferase [bacterium]
MRWKITTRKALAAAVRRLQAAGKKVVFTNGCFDLLHVGHVRYLQEAGALGDALVVAVNSDASVRRLDKGPGRPLNPARDRAEVLAALACVDYVTVFGEATPQRLIAAVQPDVLVKGGDWPVEKIVGRETVEARGGRVVSIPLVKNRSTTATIAKIRSAKP